MTIVPGILVHRDLGGLPKAWMRKYGSPKRAELFVAGHQLKLGATFETCRC